MIARKPLAVADSQASVQAPLSPPSVREQHRILLGRNAAGSLGRHPSRCDSQSPAARIKNQGDPHPHSPGPSLGKRS